MSTATLLPVRATEGTIQQLVATDAAIIIEAALTAPTATCPSCGTPATRVQRRHFSRSRQYTYR